jgi:hypothetical protein
MPPFLYNNPPNGFKKKTRWRLNKIKKLKKAQRDILEANFIK